MKRFTALLLLLLAALLPGHAFAENILYHVYRATLSITVVSLDTDAGGKKSLVTRQFTNKQITNLAQGRPIEAAVPANEILVWFFPDDYRRADNVRLAVFDRNTSSVLKVIVVSNSTDVGFGGKESASFLGLQSISVGEIGNATNSFGPGNGTGSFKGKDRLTAAGSVSNFSVTAMALAGNLTLNSITRPAIVTGGSVRMVGSVLLDTFADL